MNELVVSSERTFGHALFGLNKNEVYTYLNQLTSSYEELQLQIQVLKEQNDKLSDSNRENALKVYNLQGEITEAQKQSDKMSNELEAAKKQISELKKELQNAEKRVGTLTDELIKAGGEAPKDDAPAASAVKEEPKEAPKPEVKVEEKAEEKKEPEKKVVKDIFADLRSQAAAEKAEEKKAEEKKVEPEKPDTSTTSSADNFNDDEVYAGEVEVEVDESMMIGNNDDEDEGFNFL